MANPGVGNRFTSVNLNKSYGHSSHSNQSNTSGSNYGLSRGSRLGDGGVAGAMVVLSRPRSSHKAGSKLSVPPPLNLPSLRREHQKFDSLGSASGSVVGGAAGSVARPSSSGMGWSKPSAIVGAEREGVAVGGDRPLSTEGVNHGVLSVDGANREASAAYMPPSARTDVSATGVSAVGKATVLRGEDFPSLKATLSAANGSSQKQKDSAHQKHKLGMSEEPSTGGQREGLDLSSHVDMRPQVQSSQSSVGNGLGFNSREDRSSANFRSFDQGRKQDDVFPGPLPLVRLSPRSDWADDERDTSHGLTDRSRDLGLSRTEAYWDREYDLPRTSLPPLKPAQNLYDRRGQRDNDVGKGLPNEVSNADSFNRDTQVPSREGREGQSWRTPVSRDGYGPQEVVNERNSFGARPVSVNRDTNKDNKYFPSHYGGNIQDEYNVGPAANRDYATGRRDHGRQQWNNSSELNNGRGFEKNNRDRYANNSSRFKTADVQYSPGLRSSFSSGNKGLSGGDHLSNFSRDKHSSSRNEKPYVEDPFSGFDGQDSFPGSMLGVVKRKKDANKPLDFHDPVRESFEAELERVQRIQEQTRQRIVEEQEKAQEMARREEEERQRVAKEQEEHHRRLEEEAQEAAWRAEQERLDSIRRAEELRIAREDEKQRMMMEEERRKQAAKQKLLELEEKIAKRQAETSKISSSSAIPGDMIPGVAKERDVPAEDFACWEDGERMVERITNSASSDSSHSRPFDLGSRPVAAREGSFAFADRGKSFNSWRRDIFENGNNSSFFSAGHDNGHESLRRDVSMGGRSFPRKDLYAGQGYMPTRGYYRGGIPEPHMDDFPHPRGHRWNISGDGDPYGRNMEYESDFPDNVADRFDLGWGQGRGRGNSPFPERFYQNSDLAELYSHGRSRYPARQPRVLPPPSLSSVQRTSFRGESERPDSSAYVDENIQLNQALRSESAGLSYKNAHEEHSEILDAPEHSSKNVEQELNRSTTPGHDSQSSLSVSSPPSSPTHLSHDDLDEARESLAVHARAESQDISLSENEAKLISAQMVSGDTMATPSSVSVGDDEEWTIDDNEALQVQDEYDEDVGYHEEDVHEGDDENVELNHEFEELHLEGKDSPHLDNMVLGFDQGVEVGIPNDDYEKSPRIDVSLYAGPLAAVSIVEQEESVDGSRDGQSMQVADVAVSIDSSRVMVQQTEKAVELTNAPSSLDPLDTRDSTPSLVSSAQQSVSSPAGTNSMSSNQSLPSVAGANGPADLPVKLQFGLFSGPSLIPSPVPAIQIGSIQMPLQLHPQIGPSLTHVHASQPPLFQFGQLRYPSPISQGILPLAPQSMSFVQPSFPTSYASSQVPGGPPPVLPTQNSSHNSLKSHHVLPHQLNVHQGSELKESNFLATSNVLLSQNQENASSMSQIKADIGQPAGSLRRPSNVMKNSKPLSNNRASDNRVGPSSHSAGSVKDSSGPSAQSQFSGGRGRRFAFTSRNPGARSFSSVNEASRSDSNGFQRKPRRGSQRFEFRVRQTAEGKQSSVLPSSLSGLDAKSSSDRKSTLPESGLTRELPSFKPKHITDSVISGSDQIQENVFGTEEDKTVQKEAAAIGGLDTSQRAAGSLKRNIGSEDDVDAPLQCGIVRVFKQPGIEAPSDEDDFIEVRSKRQMLNDRREQREKEIKAKSSNMRKAQRKARPGVQGAASARNTTRTTAPLSAQATKSIRSAVPSKRGLLNNDVSATLNNVGSQPLAPIGTPPIGSDCQTDSKAQTVKPPQTSSYSNNGINVGPDVPGLTFDSQRTDADGVQSSISTWVSPSINQPVMALTQTQLEEAMKPAHFDKHVVSVGDRSSSVKDPGMPSSSARAKDDPFSSAICPINSLLAGEKIQFGAVTSPTILPPSTHVSHNIRPPASLTLDAQRPQSMPATQNNRDILFEKEKHTNESCSPFEDHEAEAAASAVAVAAIGNDEVVGNGIGSCSAAISDPSSFGGMSVDQHAASQSKAEETLSVSLPADLSVETLPISIWPPLPSPHSSSSQMLSQFPGGPTSHFPYYDMNPMMGGPVFAFGPHEDSTGTQSQPQKNNVSSSGPLGTWQQCHTGVDSFYGPPAGFTAPFISPPGSMPGVQGPPHMVVYNHFTPVGQFGQVGLSYMGTTYIPSGKQPDWKRSSASALGGSEGEMNNTNFVPVQRSAPHVPAQVQHLAPGSPLLSMASPLAMFEVSPFQSSPDVSVHPRWSHVQPSSIHPIPQSVLLQQQAEGVLPSQSSHGSADHLSLNANGFVIPQTSSSLEDGRSSAVGSMAAATQLPNELGLVNPPVSAGSEALSLHVRSNSRSGDSVKVDVSAGGSGSRRNPHVAVSAPNKAQVQSAKQKVPSGQQQYNHYQRGGGQKNGAEWSNRKMGFHGRNQSSGGERGIPHAKVKQIYVAKQNNSNGT